MKWQKKQWIKDETLFKAVVELLSGLYDARLTGVLYKKRIPVCGRGKRGGARTIIAYRQDDHLFFLYGFLKNEFDNITDEDKRALEHLAKIYFLMSPEDIAKALKSGDLEEISHEI